MDAHKRISFMKSGLRLIGCVFGYLSSTDPAIMIAFVFLFGAEIVGIVEEMVV